MNQVLKALFFFSFILLTLQQSRWAVLVAGSKDYSDYAHQANVCHAYHVLLRKGFDPTKIITFNYNDVVTNPQNPFPGQLFSFPSPNSPGIDVQEGCVLDYTGTNVTKENFLNVIKGNASAVKNIGTGRVLESKAEDRVFFYMNDHGIPGGFHFPDCDDCFLLADELLDAIKYMKSQQMYLKMVIYMEACYSGSMFQNLTADLNVFATTSSTAQHPSYYWYCGGYQDSNVVNGTSINTCMSGQYSSSWMQNCDTSDISNITLGQQYEYVLYRTQNLNYNAQSNASKFGDFSLLNDPVSDFLGTVNGQLSQEWITDLNSVNPVNVQYMPQQQPVSQHNVDLFLLQSEYLKNNTQELQQKIYSQLSKRDQERDVFRKIAKAFGQNETQVMTPPAYIDNFPCYKQLLNNFISICGGFSNYSRQFAGIFAHVCQGNVRYNQQYTKAVFQKSCSQNKKNTTVTQ